MLIHQGWRGLGTCIFIISPDTPNVLGMERILLERISIIILKDFFPQEEEEDALAIESISSSKMQVYTVIETLSYSLESLL